MTDSERDQNEAGEQSLDEIIAENERLLQEYLAQGDAEAPVIEDTLPDGHRSGFVAVVGKPNVGKSTLMNALLGEKVAIVSPKPQTTRERQLGIYTDDDAQIVFVDTPGIHEARTKLGEYMVDVAKSSIPDADVIVFIVAVPGPPTRADEAIAEVIGKARDVPVILALNKRDLLADETQEQENVAAYRALLPNAQPLLLSATEGYNVDALLELILENLPEGPRFYPADRLTETQVRDTVAEIIREKVLLQYEDEVPHSVAVQVTQFKERSEDLTYIAATIFVERDSQKRILIGKGGSALKELGRRARAEIEPMLGTQVFLELWVKVLKNWRRDESALRRLGYEERR
jgi:GTP-binding protein Era